MKFQIGSQVRHIWHEQIEWAIQGTVADAKICEGTDKPAYYIEGTGFKEWDDWYDENFLEAVPE